MRGALLVDKPSGPTSHDVVAFTRRLLKTKRVGHTGTLDPLATGLLVMLVGPATRLSQFLVLDEKEYVADVRLGVSTPTYDAASLDRGSGMGDWGSEITLDEIRSILPDFVGTFPQLPPPFSAKKIEGTRAYERARKSEPVELRPVIVTVKSLEILTESAIPDSRPPTPDPRSPSSPPLRLRVVASSGFYVRSLAHDLGKVLGCGAHLEALRRIRAGRFRVEDAATLDVLEAEGTGAASRLVSMNTLLADYPAVGLTPEGLRRAGHGNTLAPEVFRLKAEATATPRELRAGERVRVLDASGEVLSVAELGADGLLHPLLVLR